MTLFDTIAVLSDEQIEFIQLGIQIQVNWPVTGKTQYLLTSWDTTQLEMQVETVALRHPHWAGIPPKDPRYVVVPIRTLMVDRKFWRAAYCAEVDVLYLERPRQDF